MKISKRQERLAVNKLLKKDEGKFTPIPAENLPKFMTRAYRNNRYTVMIMDNEPMKEGTAIRAMIRNHTQTPIINHWAELQRIKNELFGEEAVGVEYHPAESELIDHFNIYWLWVFPDGNINLPILTDKK